jgi:hypothetical protein
MFHLKHGSAYKVNSSSDKRESKSSVNEKMCMRFEVLTAVKMLMLDVGFLGCNAK